MAHAGGCPRTVSPPPEQMIELGKEMVAWVKEHNPIHLNEWYCLEKNILYKDWCTMIKRPEFVGYYEQAIALVGKHYINGESKKVKESVVNRWHRIYFRDLCTQEDNDKKDNTEIDLNAKKQLLAYEAELKANALDKVPDDIKGAFSALMNQFERKSDLSQADSTNSNDIKSI